MNILALDQATHCGWAISNELYGVWDLTIKKDESIGMKLIRFRSKLKEVCESEGIKLIVYERIAGRFKHAIIHAAKLIAVTEIFCEENGIEFKAYSSPEIKKFATGKGNAKKPAMIAAAKEKYNYPGNDDNEADALHLLNLAKKDLNL